MSVAVLRLWFDHQLKYILSSFFLGGGGGVYFHCSGVCVCVYDGECVCVYMCETGSVCETACLCVCAHVCVHT